MLTQKEQSAFDVLCELVEEYYTVSKGTKSVMLFHKMVSNKGGCDATIKRRCLDAYLKSNAINNKFEGLIKVSQNIHLDIGKIVMKSPEYKEYFYTINALLGDEKSIEKLKSHENGLQECMDDTIQTFIDKIFTTSPKDEGETSLVYKNLTIELCNLVLTHVGSIDYIKNLATTGNHQTLLMSAMTSGVFTKIWELVSDKMNDGTLTIDGFIKVVKNIFMTNGIDTKMLDKFCAPLLGGDVSPETLTETLNDLMNNKSKCDAVPVSDGGSGCRCKDCKHYFEIAPPSPSLSPQISDIIDVATNGGGC